MSKNMVQTVAGDWVKVKGGTRGITLEMPKKDLLLMICPSTRSITFYVKDSNGVYQYLSDISFEEVQKGKMKAMWFSPSFEES